jgi:hypothetical protein
MDEGILMKKGIFDRKFYEDVVEEEERMESEELSVICAALGRALDRSGTGRIGKTKTPNQGVLLAVRTQNSGHKANNSGIDHSRETIDQGQTTGMKGKPSGRKRKRKVSERLVRAKDYFYVPVTPKSWVHEIIHENHDTPRVGHQGVKKLMDLIKRSCFWKGIKMDIREYVITCLNCQRTKVLKTLPYVLLEPAIPARRVFETILCSFMEPFPASGQGCQNKYLLVIVDEFSR